MQQIIIRSAITIVLAWLASGLSSAQITYFKTYEEIYTPSIKQTSDGGGIIMRIEQDDLILIKLNSSGDTLWTKVFGGLNVYKAWDIHQTNDGGFVITAGVDTTQLNTYLLLLRIDSIGNEIWNKLINVPLSVYGMSGIRHATVVQTADGGFFCSFSANWPSYYSGYFKTDANGNTLWKHNYSDSYSLMKQTVDTGIILVRRNYDWLGIGFNLWSKLTKINQFGTIEWEKEYDALYDNNIITALNQTMDGGYILATIHYNYSSGHAFALIRTNEFGDTLWTRGYNNDSCNIYSCNSVLQTSDGGFVASYNNFIVKTDSLGIPIWSNNYSLGNMSTQISTLQASNDGGFIISGYVRDTLTNIRRNCLIKTDSNFNSGCNLSGCVPTVTGYSPGVNSWGPSNPNSTQLSHVSYPLLSSSWDSIIDINTLCYSLGVENIEIESKLLVYPNPGNGIFNLQLNNKNNEQVSITVFDVTGRIIFAKDFGKHGELFNETIDLSNLFDGVYLMQVATGEHTFSQKVIVQHN